MRHPKPVEGAQTADSAAVLELPTPYFVIDQNELDRNIETLKQALAAHWPNAIIGYSFKTNSLPWLIDYLKQQDLWAEVVSDDEYLLARQMGYPFRRIIYNGIIKSQQTFSEAVRQGSIVNLDSRREIAWLKSLLASPQSATASEPVSYAVGLRVNVDLEKHCPGEAAMGEEGGRFGFSYENGDLEQILLELKQYPQVRVAGLHLHTGTKTRSLQVYRTLARLACELKETYQLDLDYLDIGGGFYGGLANKPQYPDYLRVISEELHRSFDSGRTRLIVEPGTSLISSPIAYVTSVIDTKHTTRNCFVVTDGSRISIDPLHHKQSYFHQLLYQPKPHPPNFTDSSTDTPEPVSTPKISDPAAGRPVLAKQVISGFTCMEDDRLFVLENQPALQPGDRIRYEKVGAYTMSLTPLFIRYFPAVYLFDGHKHQLIEPRWTPADYLRHHTRSPERAAPVPTAVFPAPVSGSTPV